MQRSNERVPSRLKTPRTGPRPHKPKLDTLGLLSRLTREPEGIAPAIERSLRLRVQRQEPDLCGLWAGVRLHRVRAGLLRAARLHRASSVRQLPGQPQGCPQRRRRRQFVWRVRRRRRLLGRRIQLRRRRRRVQLPRSAARCSRPPARPAARKPRSRSSPRAASPSTAATASEASAGSPAGRRARPFLRQPIDPGRQPTRIASCPAGRRRERVRWAFVRDGSSQAEPLA